MSDAPRLVQLRTLAWFGLTGVVGFVVDAGVLHLMVTRWNANLFLARACSFTCAVTTTWMINRTVTFSMGHRTARRLLAEWAAYFMASAGGGSVNYVVFVLAVHLSSTLYETPSIAVGIGTLVGTAFNFVMYAKYIFRKRG